jgi:riboflavin synthase
MFTGLISELGSVTGLDLDEAGATIQVSCSLAAQLHEGDSIAVNGVCLTATQISDEGFHAQAMIETLERSSLGGLHAGSPVNLELPLRAQDRLGGHVVQGHVDGKGTVSAVREQGFARVLEVEVAPQLARYLVERGSVALDGVSLTICALSPDGFAVALIPETQQRTNLGAIAVGGVVNIEVDILAKHVERLMNYREAHV